MTSSVHTIIPFPIPEAAAEKVLEALKAGMKETRGGVRRIPDVEPPSFYCWCGTSLREEVTKWYAALMPAVQAAKKAANLGSEVCIRYQVFMVSDDCVY